MAKLEIGKGSIYTRYPNDTFRNGYDGIKWDSKQDAPAEWYGTRYEMVEPEYHSYPEDHSFEESNTASQG